MCILYVYCINSQYHIWQQRGLRVDHSIYSVYLLGMFHEHRTHSIYSREYSIEYSDLLLYAVYAEAHSDQSTLTVYTVYIQCIQSRSMWIYDRSSSGALVYNVDYLGRIVVYGACKLGHLSH
jgi:hypothetical protein